MPKKHRNQGRWATATAIAVARLERKVSGREVERRAGLYNGAISKIERCQRPASPQALERIRQAIGISSGALLDLANTLAAS